MWVSSPRNLTRAIANSPTEVQLFSTLDLSNYSNRAFFPYSISLLESPNGFYKFRSKATEIAPPESNSACRTTVATSGTGDKAYCPDVRPSRGGRKKSTTRQSVG